MAGRSNSKKTYQTTPAEEAPNYLSVGIGYLEHAISPLTEKWGDWTGNQRIIAILIILPLFFFPALFILGFILPWALFLFATVYISLFGWATSRRHAHEAFQERIKDNESFEELRKKALLLKERTGNFATDMLYYAVDSIAVVAHYLLAGLMSAVDYLIELLLGVSRSLNVQKKKLEQNRPNRSIKNKSGSSTRPIIAKLE
jgi:hypothetical protein